MPDPPLPQFVSTLRALAPREKRALVAANLARLEQDLWSDALRFTSLPRIVDVQFSNFCNMACTMCYPQGNPPLQKLADDLLEKLAAATFPTASILVPFAGSEPLILTWDLTRRLAQLYGLELDVVTNVQFLDEKKFAELEPLVTSIRVSIDSHKREVYERIRLKSKPDAVFRNLAVAARLCREHGIEVQTNVVFMAENALHLDETIGALADLGIPTFHLLQYHYSDPAGAASDPWLVHPPEAIAAVFERIRRVAREKRLRVVFDLREKEFLDHRPPELALRENPKNDPWLERFRRFFPGYCLQSVNRVKVNADGTVYPCCVADKDQLALGNLKSKSFDEIWNGPEARDLRRAMVTQDLPSLCRDCSFTKGWTLPPQPWLPFVDTFARDELRTSEVNVAADAAVVLESPAHAARTSEPPTLSWRLADGAQRPQRWVVALALGGESAAGSRTFEVDGAATSLTIPRETWLAMRPNMAWWWTVFAVSPTGAPRRAALARCLTRHSPIPRVEGSTLYGAELPIFKFSPVTPSAK